jgi:hypothetical protein
MPQRYCRSCHAAYMRDWRPTHPLEGSARVRDIARSTLNMAVQRHRIERMPCEVCGAQPAEGHHWHGYKGFELDVQWLCRPHHLKVHPTN